MITDPTQRGRILDTFPFLRAASADFRDTLLDSGTLMRLPAGHLICQDGSECAALPLVLSGIGRVYKLGENGREITLYRVEPGQSCVVTASCILSGRPFPAIAECETQVEALVVRPSEVRQWMGTSTPWREYVFGLIAGRLQEVFGVLDAVLFQRLDQRLVALLLGMRKAAPGRDIRMTHQALAAELGSSREVISRVLKGLEGQGLLRITRGHIELLDIPELERRAREG
ncbi:Crp/Fnr family transcriptional regulator [Imhoffiella purpurea]|uniref:Transcriptional regulator, Crp/Fnr family n=1 Tax=Imhoffiella purpurea TaxID=1249627 RepID=W9V5F6_9GAMM|nr:Crp/Fnr family transcriptional regulator [Imhoffiella purpurea]EXJ14584.1 transcriptional regulator, Crp/Fnr family [Imhoffiella purpurea]